MLRFAKYIGCLAALLLGLESARSFSLMGPFNEVWQVPEIGYNLPGDIGAPKNIAEEYRWNTPVVYYAFDQTFLDYFGSNGVWAVEQAIGILNNLTNVSSYSADLSEFPLQSRRINRTAESLHLLDLKSIALNVLVEELGLADPDRWVWTLHGRRTQPGLNCPFMIYDVVMRNFDPVTYEYSAYINSVLYTYLIIEFCTGTPTAFTFNFSSDPNAQDFTAVASMGIFTYGAFSSGLTRDDVGGFRYLWRSNNFNWEQPSQDSLAFYTNQTQAQLLFTSNLTQLAEQALTNNAAGLAAAYPGLNVVATTNFPAYVWVTNLTAYFTNSPWDPSGTFPLLVFVTNRTLTVQMFNRHTFGNLVTFQSTPSGWVAAPIYDIFQTNRAFMTLQTIVATNAPWAPLGSVPVTQVMNRTFITNMISGEFAILPTNGCDYAVIAAALTNLTIITNQIVNATNAPTLTNAPPPTGGTNQFGGTNTFQFTQNLLTYFTNHVFLVYPVECLQTNNANLRGGMEKIRFVRANYDSLIGQFFEPITNTYRLPLLTNSTLYQQTFRRVVTQPDVLFTAAVPSANGEGSVWRPVTAGNYITNNELPALAGPGNIEPRMTFTFNKVGPLLINLFNTNIVQDGLGQFSTIIGTNFIWGSFDGTTNPPIIYPSSVSLSDLEAQLFFQIVTASLPDARVGVLYSQPIQIEGGKAPFTWAPAAGSAPLPAGLALGSGGVVSGTPTTAGFYMFSVTATDSEGRSTARTISITVSP